MISNRDLVKYGRELEERKAIDARVSIMCRVSNLREKIQWAQETIKSLEKELEEENRKLRDRSQLPLGV